MDNIRLQSSETDEICASNLMGKLCHGSICSDYSDFITCLNSDETNCIMNLLDLAIDNMTTVLKYSKMTTGVIDKQEEIEDWLLNILREIYKNKPNAFSNNQIQKLKTVVLDIKGERKQVIPIDSELKDGEYVIRDNSVSLVWINQCWFGLVIQGVRQHRTTKAFQDILDNHREYLSNILSIFSVADISVSPAIIAQLFLKRVEFIREKNLRENFNRIRSEKSLPDAELRQSKNKKHRVTHCYSCKGALETGIFLECSLCNWLVCSCGACGCGYSNDLSTSAAGKNSDPSYREDGDIESWTEISDSWALSENNGWYYNDSDEKIPSDY